ncbi:MAG: ribonuclease HII [Clostridia bacterium]|nr:ribonuclease HII [Clostridia bacterium]
MLDLNFDLQYQNKYGVVCGVDEAGRGPLAGPVAAGACILRPGVVIEGLDDSKKLTEKKREALYDVIIDSCEAWGVGLADEGEIDRINILEAALLAMRRAIEATGVRPDFLLIDGNQKRGFTIPAETVVKGDGISQSIAAASVLAKVTRDRIMKKLDAEYPGYGFARHMGYPTKEHKLAVFTLGPSPVHRRSFLSFLERDREKLEREAKEAGLIS